MTCIVGIQHEGIVYVGGDSLGVSGYVTESRQDEKVFFNGPMVMGYTTSFRMGQLLRYALKVPKHPSSKNDMEYLTTTFVDSIRKLYSDKGFLKKSSDAESGGNFLLGYKGKLYEVHDDFQIGVPMHEFSSCGAGWEIALGALYVTQDMEPIKRINLALEAASEFCGAVRGPFIILKLGKKNSKVVVQ